MTAAEPFETGKFMDSKRQPPLSEGSRFFQRLQRRYSDVFATLPTGIPQRELLNQAYTTLRQQGHDVGSALRILRQWAMAQFLSLDCEKNAALESITLGVTHLAELALDEACKQAFADLDVRHGAPLTALGERAQFWVVGMGKLGARELNVSSDIDLIYVYDEDGETAGNEQGLGKVSVQEYFSRAVKAIYTLVG
jgi:glutamate-ammonia-ligase adenylyltransferase